MTLEPEQLERRLHAERREAVRARRRDGRLLHRRRQRATGASSSSATPTASRSRRRRRSTRTRKQYAVKLDGVKVGEDAAFGGDGAMEPARVRAYIALAAELTGIAQRAMEMARRLREGAQAVRPPDRRLPGGVAPLRADAARDRGRALGHLLRGLGRRQRARDGAARRLDGEGLCLRRGHARDRRVAPGPRRHRLHLGARPPPVPEARAAADAVMFGDARWHRERVAQHGDRRAPARDARSRRRDAGRREARPAATAGGRRRTASAR